MTRSLDNGGREVLHRELKSYFRTHARGRAEFVPGETKVQYSGPVYDDRELSAMLDAMLDGWFGVGKFARKFESSFARWLGAKHALLVNSGSSGNLLAVTSLIETGRLKKGDEVITPAVTFPTTLNPLLQCGLRPVLVDVDLETYNAQPEALEQAASSKTCLMMLPHTLGIPNDMDRVMRLAVDGRMSLIEDSCDALGSTYSGKKTGTFGVLGTFSFYVAHQMTMGEGGAVVTSDPELMPALRSLRDWGRACVCPICLVSKNPDYQCPQRFSFDAEGLPEEYDKRYVYQHIGYNLKPVEFQAAMGLEQLKRLPSFIEARKRNFSVLRRALEKYQDYFVLPRPPSTADPSWFAFPITLKGGIPFTRKELVSHLEEHNIETRMLFAGNIMRQPAYRSTDFRVAGNLKNSDKVMKDAFFIGVYPGLTEVHMGYVIETLTSFLKRF